MASTLCAVVGSANPQRMDYRPPLSDATGASAAAEAIGKALAAAGCSLLVYSGDESFIEASVVRGFVAGDPPPSARIVVRFPADGANVAFPEAKSRPNLFDFRPDSESEWQSSYYRSMNDADGVILIGGGSATLVMGYIAISSRTPILTLADFGGAAACVWRSIIPDRDLPTQREHALMSKLGWSPNRAAPCVQALLDQIKRRAGEGVERELRSNVRSVIVIMLFVVTLVILAFGIGETPRSGFRWLVLTFLLNCLSGGSGAATRALWIGSSDPIIRRIALGSVAGGISGLFYIGGQVLGAPDILRGGGHPEAIMLLSMIMGLIAGFTFDAVFKKLDEKNALSGASILKDK